jgi:hypothetical protein
MNTIKILYRVYNGTTYTKMYRFKDIDSFTDRLITAYSKDKGICYCSVISKNLKTVTEKEVQNEITKFVRSIQF